MSEIGERYPREQDFISFCATDCLLSAQQRCKHFPPAEVIGNVGFVSVGLRQRSSLAVVIGIFACRGWLLAGEEELL